MHLYLKIYQTQYFMTQTPKNMVDSNFGLKSQTLDYSDISIDEDENEDQQIDLIQKIPFIQDIQQNRRILDQDPTNPEPVFNTTVDEYYKQGPLISIYCGFGQQILLNVTKYFCSQQRVTKKQYEQEIKKDLCEIRYRLSYGCLCPPDFYDIQCLKWNQIICEIDQPFKDCQSLNNKDYYNENIDGNPPCFELQNDKYVENVRAVCKNFDLQMLHPSVYSQEESFEVIWSNYSRGISALSLQLYKFSLPNPSDPNDPQFYIQFALPEEEEKQLYKFDYQPLFFDAENLKSSFQFTMNPYITYINWTNLRESKTTLVQQDLSESQLLGQEYITITIQTDNMVSLFGRYSIEIGLIINITHFYSIQKYVHLHEFQDNLIYKPQFQPKILFFEDLSFKGYLYNYSQNLLMNLHQIKFFKLKLYQGYYYF
ncbi:unnamed protein product [Paramecium pentaurelia]|uniref:Uncharacterized protein n=1 Tax=Paramecium pentaurelia TaxID=43138 RepID=A0A8S1U4M1_9CILI|nr:unnamed protein product [Paramecium pentaurelia]